MGRSSIALNAAIEILDADLAIGAPVRVAMNASIATITWRRAAGRVVETPTVALSLAPMVVTRRGEPAWFIAVYCAAADPSLWFTAADLQTLNANGVCLYQPTNRDMLRAFAAHVTTHGRTGNASDWVSSDIPASLEKTPAGDPQEGALIVRPSTFGGLFRYAEATLTLSYEIAETAHRIEVAQPLRIGTDRLVVRDVAADGAVTFERMPEEAWRAFRATQCAIAFPQ
jgi:hypothetical protein